MTSPSSNFSVAPPRKQASTGNNATVALAIQRVAAALWFLSGAFSVWLLLLARDLDWKSVTENTAGLARISFRQCRSLASDHQRFGTAARR